MELLHPHLRERLVFFIINTFSIYFRLSISVASIYSSIRIALTDVVVKYFFIVLVGLRERQVV